MLAMSTDTNSSNNILEVTSKPTDEKVVEVTLEPTNEIEVMRQPASV